MQNIKCVGFYWRTCDFPVWERVKHIVPVYNAPPLLQIKESGQNPAHYTTLNTVD